MIKSFIHKGLKKFYETGNTAGINSAHSNRIKIRLVALDTATNVKDMDLPGFRLHSLSGKLKDLWAIDVNKAWRITFKFENGAAYIVNYENYH